MDLIKKHAILLVYNSANKIKGTIFGIFTLLKKVDYNKV